MKLYLIAAALCLPLISAAQAVTSRTSATRSIGAYRLEHPIKVDGQLNEPEWLAAPSATGFTQAEPHAGSPGTDHRGSHSLRRRASVRRSVPARSRA